MGTIYTIGHGNLSFTDFVQELKSYDIRYLIDVRSKPFSKWCPYFNQEPLKNSLQKEGIIYGYMGNLIGGLPSDPSCYTNAKVDYIKVAEKDFFKAGLLRLIHAAQQELRVAIMCSETDPQLCHRYKLIGKELTRKNIPVIHIVGANKVKTQLEIDIEATQGWGSNDLFGIAPATSRKKYASPSYVPTSPFD